jgi:hypothetical protein
MNTDPTARIAPMGNTAPLQDAKFYLVVTCTAAGFALASWAHCS